jgi:hypothetical protein
MEIYGNKNDQPTHEHIEWLYPEIYDRSKQSTITIDLYHTRSSDGIRIKYDSERDGWVIEQASVFEWECDDQEQKPDWQEVAFIKSWAREGNNDRQRD